MTNKPEPPLCPSVCIPVGTMSYPVPYRSGEAHAFTLVCARADHQTAASAWVKTVTGQPGVFQPFDR